MTTKEIQEISFKILQDVHSFCLKHNIKYSLAYGTLLGAVRHKDFIPWDDDVDIIMPRQDYDRFCRLYKSDRFEIFPSYSDNCYLAYTRVCDMEETLVIPYAPWCNKSTGIWIDIFPIDGASPDLNKQDNQYRKALLKYHILNAFRVSSLKKFENPYYFLLYIKMTILYKNINFIKNSLIDLCEKIPYGSTNYIQVLSCLTFNKKMIHKLSWFAEYILLPFGKDSFYCIKGYDKYLTNLYGDYMQLPPLEDRISSHKIHKYYWKKY